MSAGPGSDRDAADRVALDRAGDTRRPRFLAVARRYARHRVARGLDGLWVAGLTDARAALSDRPVIFVANHVSWWDAILLIVLDEALGGLGWAVMDARNLRGLPFLGWVGALPLDRSSHERSRQCLESCAALLDRPGRAMWIFPQGRQRPAHLRPLDLRHGVQTLHEHAPVDVVAVSVNYVFLERDRPAALIRFATPHAGAEVAGAALLSAVEHDLLDGLAIIDTAAAEATDGGRARRHPEDPLPGFAALVRPKGFATPNGVGGRLLRVVGRRRRRAR